MEFRELVRRRRMVRAYREQPVDPSLVTRLLDVARRAPSAGFAQGQRFVVVTDPVVRAELGRLAGEDGYVARGFDPWLSRAPVHVVVCVDVAAYHARYREADKLDTQRQEPGWPVPYWYVDGGASLVLLLLAAVDAGLAAGFFGVHRLPGLRRLLAIPDVVHPIGVVTIGYPAPDRPSSSLRRGWLPLDAVVFWGRWGGVVGSGYDRGQG